MARKKGQCWDCNGTGVKAYWAGGRKVETTCPTCGGTGEK